MIEISNSSDAKDVPAATAKREYRAPRLEEFGDLRGVTLTTGVGSSNPDAGAGNFYHS